jgi:hypothetical protein
MQHTAAGDQQRIACGKQFHQLIIMPTGSPSRYKVQPVLFLSCGSPPRVCGMHFRLAPNASTLPEIDWNKLLINSNLL